MTKVVLKENIIDMPSDSDMIAEAMKEVCSFLKFLGKMGNW